MGARAAVAPVAVDVRVHGRVQGVFFRASTRDQARRHGVTGWIRNEPDGSVRAHLEGSRGAVDAVVAWMRRGGPSGARVDGVDVTDTRPDGHDTFRVVHG